MSVPVALRQRLTQTLTVYAVNTRDKYGDASYASASSTYRCRVEQNYHEVVDTHGRDVMAKTRIIVESTGIAVTDKITLPDGTTPPVYGIETHIGVGLGVHQVIHCG